MAILFMGGQKMMFGKRDVVHQPGGGSGEDTSIEGQTRRALGRNPF
jgi:hypothetical protein